jgi:hypothetical protein
VYRSRVIGNVGVGFGAGPKDVVDGTVVDGSVDAVAGGVALQAVAATRIVRRPSSVGLIH